MKLHSNVSLLRDLKEQGVSVEHYHAKHSDATCSDFF